MLSPESSGHASDERLAARKTTLVGSLVDPMIRPAPFIATIASVAAAATLAARPGYVGLCRWFIKLVAPILGHEDRTAFAAKYAVASRTSGKGLARAAVAHVHARSNRQLSRPTSR
jgi:hypothetical protein